MLPVGFIEMMRGLLNEEADEFLEAMTLPPVTSVRLNRRKPLEGFTPAEEVELIAPGAIPVPWCADGFYLPERPVFTLDPLLHAGAYYVQDASSMIHQEVISRILDRLRKSTSEESSAEFPVTLLDMCAAPGGKTTAMINALPDRSRVVANEYVSRRATILRENLTKWGYPDVCVTSFDSSRFAQNGDRFDIIAVDAPCSGEGMMRKDDDAVNQWSPELIRQCAGLQREILTNAVNALAPGGYLIYSTCTFNTVENEEMVEYICNTLDLDNIDLELPSEWGIRGGISTDRHVYRFMPHRTQGEGLFLAVFRKPGQFSPSVIPSVVKPSAGRIFDSGKKNSQKNSPNKGKEMSRKGYKATSQQEEIPEIEDILSINFDRNRYPLAELTKEQALSYLRRESVVLPSDTPKGICIVTYKGLPLGAVKNIGSRANNLYPKSWRILMR